MEQINQYSLFGKDDKVHLFFALVPEGLVDLYIENQVGNYYFFFGPGGK
jgi:hypothetical protein